MRYIAFAILSITNISGDKRELSHYGVPHDLDGETTIEETTPVVEPDNDNTIPDESLEVIDIPTTDESDFGELTDEEIYDAILDEYVLPWEVEELPADVEEIPEEE